MILVFFFEAENNTKEGEREGDGERQGEGEEKRERLIWNSRHSEESV